jgi:hypothetical protein
LIDDCRLLIFEGGRQIDKPADVEDRLIDLPLFLLRKSTINNQQSTINNQQSTISNRILRQLAKWGLLAYHHSSCKSATLAGAAAWGYRRTGGRGAGGVGRREMAGLGRSRGDQGRYLFGGCSRS